MFTRSLELQNRPILKPSPRVSAAPNEDQSSQKSKFLNVQKQSDVRRQVYQKYALERRSIL
jgi:hypothetical protein